MKEISLSDRSLPERREMLQRKSGKLNSSVLKSKGGGRGNYCNLKIALRMGHFAPKWPDISYYPFGCFMLLLFARGLF